MIAGNLPVENAREELATTNLAAFLDAVRSAPPRSVQRTSLMRSPAFFGDGGVTIDYLQQMRWDEGRRGVCRAGDGRDRCDQPRSTRSR
jgi:hypothetical protein